jgi:hypothetical protein
MATLSSRPTVTPDVEDLARQAATPVVNTLRYMTKVFQITDNQALTASEVLLTDLLECQELDDWVISRKLSTSLQVIKYDVAVKHKPEWPFVYFDVEFRVI